MRRDENGEWIPLADRRFFTDELVAERIADGSVRSREEIEAGYMPDFSLVSSERMGIQAYETTTEGTPISPVFPDTPDGRFALVQYCADHETTFGPYTATPTEWAQILFGHDQLAVNIETGTIDLVSEPARQN